MKIKVKSFGIAKEILGKKETIFELEGNTVSDLRRQLFTKYEALSALKSMFIAVNQQYAEDAALLNETDEIALIPPVAGG